MEYVAGETVNELIGNKEPRIRDVLKYAIQIADALSAVHAVGSCIAISNRRTNCHAKILGFVWAKHDCSRRSRCFAFFRNEGWRHPLKSRDGSCPPDIYTDLPIADRLCA
jgi:hypothetical protein